jgi:hypothetical protein
VPNRVSKDLGKLDTKRQLSVGRLCAIDGAASAAAPAPMVAFFKNERLCISVTPLKIMDSYIETILRFFVY